MTKSKKNVLEQDSTLRLIYAFNYYTSINENWEEDSNITAHNREIIKSMGFDGADAYFIFANRFYAINYQKENEQIIHCELKEYDNFYDLAQHVLTMKFDYAIDSKELKIIEEKNKKVGNSKEQYQKVRKAA